jgi:hypothetical protein
MAFNLTSWSRRGRDFARGDPPPRGSIEYVGVGDMWMPEPPRRGPAPARAAAPSPPRVPAAPSPSRSPEKSNVPWLLALGGAAYLGISYLACRILQRPTAVAVPDAVADD